MLELFRKRYLTHCNISKKHIPNARKMCCKTKCAQTVEVLEIV